MGNNTTAKNRIPRHKRVKCAPRMKLTERDKKIIVAVYENRFLRRDQIERLFFSNTSACNHRLMKLYQHKYLDRLYKPVDFGSSQAVYALDKRGADVVQQLGIEGNKIRWSRRQNKVEFLFLEHTLAVSEFRVNLELAIRKRGDVQLLFWKRGSKEFYDRVPDPEGKRKYLTVTPDAFFGIKTPEGKSYFFLEIDMGTETNTRFKRKIQAYQQYWKTERYAKSFGFKSFRLLTVTTGSRRLKNLLKTTYDTGGRNMFLFTLTEQIIEETVLKTIWRRPTSGKFISILE